MKKILFALTMIALLCASCSPTNTQSEESNEVKQVEAIDSEDPINNIIVDNEYQVEVTDTSSSASMTNNAMSSSSLIHKKQIPSQDATKVPLSQDEASNSSVVNITGHNSDNMQCEPVAVNVLNQNGGNIIIYTFPPRAKIYLDNEYVGTSPYSASIDNMNHVLVVEKAGYFKIDEIVNFKNKTNLVFNLTKLDESTRLIYDPSVDD